MATDNNAEYECHHSRALAHDAVLLRERVDQRASFGSSDNNSTSDNQRHIDVDRTDKWSAFYPNERIAVVTSESKPPLPPTGYVPLRVGHARQDNNNSEEDGNEPFVGFSLDTLLWNEKLLEERLAQLNAWTRRTPPTQRQKLDRINWLLNHCNNNS
uniref:Uncharacterized protein n=1 Tax=Globisporangium ultimum (strain ATCC 200006 / CBS 805.95 / DAOM BR144) TaxID=431595 RepID=K3WB65_GLOUD